MCKDRIEIFNIEICQANIFILFFVVECFENKIIWGKPDPRRGTCKEFGTDKTVVK
jgi:hypothetical protein